MQAAVSVFLLAFCAFHTPAEATLENCTINTDNCKDTGGTVLCDGTFGATNGAPDQCYNDTIVLTIQKCLKTCELCCNDPQYNCKNKADSQGGTNCTTLAEMELCDSSTDPDFQALIADQCAGACGLCLSGLACPDTDPTTCQALASMCYHILYYPIMKDKCKTTCDFECDTANTTTTTTPTSATTVSGTTTTTTDTDMTTSPTTATTVTITTAPITVPVCADTATNCALNLALCSNPTYKAMMMTICAQTCGYCGGTTVACVDVNPNCAVWVRNGFCTRSFYTTAQKQQNCARSCGLC